MRFLQSSAHVLCGFALLTAAAVVAAAPADAAETKAPASTVVTVGEMCGGCVKRITAKLTPMPGVAAVSCDTVSKSVTVQPKPNTTLSPRALWEALESIGKTPTRLSGPSGTFTTKPKS